MSIHVMTWVFSSSPATGSDRLVLLAIADEADDDGGNGYPSMRRMAMKSRLGRQTVLRSVVRLEGGGELLVKRPETRGRGRHNRYVVVMGRDPLVLAEQVGWSAPLLTDEPEEWSEVPPSEWSQSGTNMDGSVRVSESGTTGGTILDHSTPSRFGSADHSSRNGRAVDNVSAMMPRPFSERPAPPPRDPDAAKKARALRASVRTAAAGGESPGES